MNQLLFEMDRFESNQGVIIMAATNRRRSWTALLRPDADRRCRWAPTEEGRLEILKIHTKKVTLAEDAHLDRIARVTAGFSGADLANIVNEAALLAVRSEHAAVTMIWRSSGQDRPGRRAAAPPE